MMSLRFGAGQPNFRPSNKRDIRAKAASGSMSEAPAQGPFSQVPWWAVPALIAAAAMPIYGLHETELLIKKGKAEAAIRIAGEKSGKKKEEPKKEEPKKEEPKKDAKKK